MSNLREMSMLASLSIHMLAGRKFDKRETAEIAKKHGVQDGVLRLSKKLFTASDVYKKVASSAGAARAKFNANTLPWDNDGSRILTSQNYMHLADEMRHCRSDFDSAWHEFVQQYPFLRAHDKNILNGVFSDADYPPVEKVKAKFGFDLEINPVPDAQDFRCDLRDEDVAEIRKQIDQSTKAKLARSMEEPYRRLFDGVAHMASRLQGAKTCPCRACKGKEFSTDDFKDSLVDNLRDLCEVLPRLNLVGDEDLEAMIDQVKISLTPFKADELRAKGVVRNTLAERAARIQADLSCYFKAA